MTNIKVGFVSLGCPKNAIDCERLLARVHAAGYEITAEETEADVIVVNTCAFIQSAKEEAIETILDLNYLKEHHDLKAIIVTGCLAQRYY
ncbi:MAG: 30S ribosomal protein S12 methylthiotransferase RimO, partial [Clostridia bacterium]|nr:30S ribosomal protein S12 methylthiotransferase RimO [Clostridia bacterium]